MDTESLSKAPREVTLAGKTYLVSKLEHGDWQAVNAWLKDRGRDPVVAALDQLSRAKAAGVVVAEEDRKALFTLAQREAKFWPPRLCSQEWFEALLAVDGASQRLLSLALRKHQPQVTDAEVARVDAEATEEETGLLFFRLTGWDPDPKAGSAGEDPPVTDTVPRETTGPT